MALTPDERRRQFEDGAAIIEELDAAIPMIRSGLGSLIQTPDRPRNLDVAMQNLAPGFERLLKLTYIWTIPSLTETGLCGFGRLQVDATR